MILMLASIRQASKVNNLLKLNNANLLSSATARNGFRRILCQNAQTMLRPLERNSSFAVTSLLQECTDLRSVKQIHARMLRFGFCENTDSYAATKILNKYVVLGGLKDACHLFDKMQEPNMFVWNIMIRAYANEGLFPESLRLYFSMQRAGVKPNHLTFPFVLRSCAGSQAVKEGRQIHCQIFKFGLEGDVFVGTGLVDFYGKCGFEQHAWKVFDEMPERNAVTWTAMIAAYVNCGCHNEALDMFQRMEREGINPTRVTFATILASCAEVKNVQEGRRIHEHAARIGLDTNAFVGSALMNMYLKCGGLDDAQSVFDNLQERNLVSWTSLIAGYTQCGVAEKALLLSDEMRLSGMRPDAVCFLSVLSACGQLGLLHQGRYLHSCVIKCCFESDLFLGTALIDMYSKCGCLSDAKEIFENMAEKSLVSWNALISGYCQNGQAGEAFLLFESLQKAGLKPDSVTATSLVSVCQDFRVSLQGNSFHAYVIKNGLILDIPVQNSLVVMYARFGDLESACSIFTEMSRRDLVSWNAMISAYDENGHSVKALDLFHEMISKHVSPDHVTMLNVLAACAHSSNSEECEFLHDFTVRNNFDSDVYVQTALLDMYANHKRMKKAHTLFFKMTDKTLVSWNVMISGYAQNGPALEALVLFQGMQLQQLSPDSVTLASLASACSQLGFLKQGKSIHGYALRRGFELDASFGNSLIAMYSKCGQMISALLVFERMIYKNVVTWSTLINGYGVHGDGENALKYFSKMNQEGVKPNKVTFLSLLSACSHAGLVEQGKQYFNSMKTCYEVSPGVEHYACMVDMLGRAGLVNEAHNLIQSMPFKPDVGVLGALLNACKIHNNVDLSENLRHYVPLPNRCTAKGRLDEVERIS